jgi:hypothetical protein
MLDGLVGTSPETPAFRAPPSRVWSYRVPPPLPCPPLSPPPSQDIAFIAFNRLITVPFLYLVVRYAESSPRVPVAPHAITVWNTVAVLPALFLLYDLVYTLMHRVMHIRALYPLVHKHHHRQHSPSRGNTDAGACSGCTGSLATAPPPSPPPHAHTHHKQSLILALSFCAPVNVHPLEFVLGEVLHLGCVWALNLVGVDVHAVTIVAFILVGGVLASLNHTRADVRVSGRCRGSCTPCASPLVVVLAYIGLPCVRVLLFGRARYRPRCTMSGCMTCTTGT